MRYVPDSDILLRRDVESGGSPTMHAMHQRDGGPRHLRSATVEGSRTVEATVRVVIVDDHALTRDGLHALLSREPGVEVVGEASDADAATDLVAKLQPDVAIIAVGTDCADGFETTRSVTVEAGSTRVLVLTSRDSEDGLFEALRAGASGFLTKDADSAELV